MTKLPAAAFRAEPPPPQSIQRPLAVAIAGYGTVGQTLAEQLGASSQFRVCAVLVRDPRRDRRVPPPCALTTDRRAFLASHPDILVDALSCAETGALLSEWALSRGIHVVSASKRVIAGCYPSLVRCAEGTGARLLYSAAVGGETPILETIAAAAAQGEIASVTAILNGTVNFILTGLARGLSFAAALEGARAAGFAEEDPTEDLSGADALAKLRIIAATAFGGMPTDHAFDVEPLDEAALGRIDRSGERWIQVAQVERRHGRIVGGVALRPRATAGPVPVADDEWNCALVTGRDGSSRSCVGRGAGGAPTASAIISDLARLTGELARSAHASHGQRAAAR